MVGVGCEFYFYTTQFIQFHSFVLYQINNSHGKNVGCLWVKKKQ